MRFVSQASVRRYAAVASIAVLVFGVCFRSSAVVVKAAAKHPVAATAAVTGPTVLMQTTKGPILIALYPKDAPISCANFEKLVKSGFYNGLMFHRVTDLGGAPGQAHIVQGGDPMSKNAQPGDPRLGMNGSGTNIKGEFSGNGVNNPLTHVVGAVAMARSSDPNSASSQFYICTTEAHALDGQYAVFGKVIQGLGNAAKIQVGDRITKATLKTSK